MAQQSYFEAGISPGHYFYGEVEGRATEIRTFNATIAPAFLQSREAMDAYWGDLDIRSAGGGDASGANLRFRKRRVNIVESRVKGLRTTYSAVIGQRIVDRAVANDKPALRYMVGFHTGQLATVAVLETSANTNADIRGDLAIMTYVDDTGKTGQIGFEGNGTTYMPEATKLAVLNRRFEELERLATPLDQYLQRFAGQF